MDAREITLSLGGRWHGHYGTAPCPVCQPERRRDQSALSLTDGDDGRLLADCKKLHCSFTDILATAGVNRGSYRAPDPDVLAQRERDRRAEVEKLARLARECWYEARPIMGTPAETYLRQRGITCALPDTLRFHGNCWHASGRRFGAMVALVEGSDGFGIHRTYLRRDGAGKAEVTPQKAMLGRVNGGAVRLSAGGRKLVVAEGIETALSLLSGIMPGPATVWAALSTSGMRALRLPNRPSRLTVAADGEDAGREAATALATRAWYAGWETLIAHPPAGRDWNDVLTGSDIEAAS